MAEYQRIENIIEQATPEYATLKVVARGTPIFPDILMKGEMRFAIRLGANLSVMTPDNLTELTAAVTVQQTILPVARVMPWLEQGALLSFNGIEQYTVADWSAADGTIIVNEPLTEPQALGDQLKLWATPLRVQADSAINASTIFVESRYTLLNGDKITFPINNLLSSLTERTVILAQSGGASGDPDFPNIFALTLDQPMPIALEAQETPMYMRAFPGYYSPVLSVPRLQNPSQMGPFLLDYLSTPLDSIPSYTETFSARTFDSGGGAIDGTLSSMITIGKNYPVVRRPMWAEGMMFWEIQRGSGGFTYPNRYRLITDDSGKARVQTRLVPAFPSGFSWSMKVTPTSSGIFRVGSAPYGFQDFTLNANQTTIVTFSTPTGGVVTELDFLTHLDEPGAQVVLQDANIQGSLVASIQYGMVFQVLGDANFQATSAIVKPYFLSLSDLSTTYDSGQDYDSGFIYL